MNKQIKIWQLLSKRKVKSSDEIVKTLLENRKIKTQKEKKEFFESPLPEEISLKDLKIKGDEVKRAVLRIKRAQKTREKVIVYGDYDADGICGTAILWETLYKLGLNVMPYIPERFSEGYGLNTESIRKLKKEDSKLGLIITVDHGIVAGGKIDIAKELGVDVIISDHHIPGKDKPKALATIHTTQIGGAGVAWVFSQEIEKKLKGKREKKKVDGGLELVAIGTIADQLPLIGINRSFVKYGLEELNKTKRPGLLALFDEAGIKLGTIGPYEVGFIIAPRINATGRLTHAIDSLRLLCVKDKLRSRDLAMHIGRTNLERQKIVDEVVVHALRQVSSGKTLDKQGKLLTSVIVISGEYHEGVIGLAAAKLVEEFYRPAIVLSKKGDISKASARSISGFNIIEAIRKLEDLYIEGGGHPMAAGFSIETRNIEKFSIKINKLAKPMLTDEILSRRLKIDLKLPFTLIDKNLIKVLRLFEPTGLGNPSPTFVSTEVRAVETRTVGREKNHLKLKLEQNGVTLDAIAFGFGEMCLKVTRDTKLDVAYNIEENVWNGNKKLQLKIKDIKTVNS